ncbi:glucokinase [Pseudophaeobacter leonis]|uniref:glucokinase n=1 Tax=Pseudophaeobacter leonis TaxID=1144477 RepID=UPI0009F56493|nr:glucokinase [Pseudophaeobacter leonis]
MARLVADLGGNCCRLALVAQGGLSFGAAKNYRNEQFGSFRDLLTSYLAQEDAPQISEMVIAVAGPVSADVAKLTNRGWRISAQDLSAQLNGARVHVLNDLSALGHALPMLQGPDLAQVHSLGDAETHPQKLVIGIGTGFNLSPLTVTSNGAICLDSEYGHVALPLDVYQALAARLAAHLPARSGDMAGDMAAELRTEFLTEFRTVECCFSGRGFEALYAAASPDSPALPAAEIMARAQQPEISSFLDFYAQILALLARNLLKGFMPRGGLYFAGTVARSLLCSPAKEAFVAEFSRPDPQFPDIKAPVFCILDDGAALKGCAGFTFPAL